MPPLIKMIIPTVRDFATQMTIFASLSEGAGDKVERMIEYSKEVIRLIDERKERKEEKDAKCKRS